MKSHILLSLVLIFAIAAPQLEAQIPQHLSYQGVYTDTLANPKPDGVYTFTFRLYETSTGGAPIWTEIKDLSVKRGLFSTLLGDATPFGSDVRFETPYWLGIKPGSEAELTPRIPLSSVGYTFKALKADTAVFALEAPRPLFVDSARVAGKVPNGSLRLIHLAVWTLAGNIGGATVPANGCAYYNFGSPTGGLVSDLVLPRSDVAVPGGTALSAYFSAGNITGGVCNFTTTAIVLPNPFVLRIYGIR